jgi:hypothetical protein
MISFLDVTFVMDVLGYQNAHQLLFLKYASKRFLRYTIQPVRSVEKRLVCNRKEPICKYPTVEINSIRLVFLVVVQ